MKHRTFGVEIECGHDDGPQGVERLFTRAGGWLPGWSFGYDGTGVEARTPVLSGPRGFKELRRALTFLRANGAWVTDSDGLHVHHGVPEIVNSKELGKQLVLSWNGNKTIVNKFVAPRRRNRGSCPHWTAAEIKRLDLEGDDDPNVQEQQYNPSTGRYEGKVYYGLCGPRGSLNLWSLTEHGTVELRLHEGTLDADQAEAWVRFGQRFINTVLERKSPLPKFSNSEELLKRVRVGQRAAKRLLDKPADPTHEAGRRSAGGW